MSFFGKESRVACICTDLLRPPGTCPYQEDCDIYKEWWSLHNRVPILEKEVASKDADIDRLKKILAKERVVQRKIHEVFRVLSRRVTEGWEECYKSFGEKEDSKVGEVCIEIPNEKGSEGS